MSDTGGATIADGLRRLAEEVRHFQRRVEDGTSPVGMPGGRDATR